MQPGPQRRPPRKRIEMAPGLQERLLRQIRRQIEETADEQAHLLDQLQTTGRPLLRVLAVLDRPAPTETTYDDPAES